jgi:hypothetical protein
LPLSILSTTAMDSFFMLEILLGVCVPMTFVFWLFYEILDYFRQLVMFDERDTL